MVILGTQNKITDIFMILAWASLFNQADMAVSEKFWNSRHGFSRRVIPTDLVFNHSIVIQATYKVSSVYTGTSGTAEGQ